MSYVLRAASAPATHPDSQSTCTRPAASPRIRAALNLLGKLFLLGCLGFWVNSHAATPVTYRGNLTPGNPHADRSVDTPERLTNDVAAEACRRRIWDQHHLWVGKGANPYR